MSDQQRSQQNRDAADWTTQQMAMVCLIIVSFCGLLGFVIIYHYASYERPIQTFAIVVDAGSTQTRSGLFTIELDAPKLREWTNELDDEQVNTSLTSESSSAPLSGLLHVKQVATCVNGGPLTAIKSQAEADELALKCLYKFSQHIKRLDFNSESLEKEETDKVIDNEKLNQQLAYLNHRVNSKTYLYLGATAGIRALQQLNETSAMEKIHWMDQAFNGSSNKYLANGPFINKGFVGVLEGSDEAAFGWAAVNFVCDKLQAKHRLPHLTLSTGSANHQTLPVYSIDGHLAEVSGDSGEAKLIAPQNSDTNNFVGTLELGGASAQMAFTAAQSFSESQIQEAGLEERNLELFNGKHRLATRSDLCMGMSQAALRVNYVLLRDAHSVLIQNSSQVEVDNPCMQRNSRVSLSSKEVGNIFKKPCLSSSSQDADQVDFRQSITNKTIVRFVGTGEVDKCNQLLANLLELSKCRRYFSLCPPNRVTQSPPIGVPFVTISGYNKALEVLNLIKQPNSDNNKTTATSVDAPAQVIADTLGGYAINYTDFKLQTKQFCAIDISEFPLKFPKLNKLFYPINCMQLVYIDKLLTEFYLFKPTTNSWKQVKFLLFEPEKKQQADKTDISWTLGLLLNATSEQFNIEQQEGSGIGTGHVLFHHGSSVLFLMRATILLMFACVLMALCFIVASIVIVQRRQTRNGLYEIHS